MQSESEAEDRRGAFAGPLFAVAFLEAAERKARHLVMLGVKGRNRQALGKLKCR